jgi:RNA polymerase sigma-70 factor (ECF subfamily)
MKTNGSVLSESDESLISRVHEGDQRAFEALMTRHRETVAKFIFRVVPDDHDREEVCQDVFVKVYFKLDQFQFSSKFTTWLYQVAYRSAVSFNRKKRLDTVEYQDHDAPSGSEIDVDTGRIRKLLDQQLAGLKLEERSVVTLHYQQDMSVDEISAIVGRPAGTVKSILHRVRGKLQHAIEKTTPDLKEAFR